MDISILSRGIKVETDSQFGPIKQVRIPKRVTLLLRQTSGSTSKALVEKGSEVKVNQKIAEASDSTGIDIHSPISGVVTSLLKITTHEGNKHDAIVIEADGKQTRERTQFDKKPLDRSAQELIDRIRRAGVVHMGRDNRSLAQVLVEALTPRGYIPSTGTGLIKPVEHLAVRLCDVDPHLSTQISVAAGIGKKIGDLRMGIDVLVKITSAANVHLVLDKRQQLPSVEKFADEADYPIHRIDNTMYPSAANPFVASTVSGKEPPIAFRRVHESGILIVDLTTVLEIADAVLRSAPVIEKVITVLGPSGVQLVRASIGTPVADVVAAAGFTVDFRKVVLNGPLNGTAIHTLDYPVCLDLSGITLFTADVAGFENQPCINCGLCAMVCPSRLLPGMLSKFCEFSQWELAENAHLFNCTECGCCAHVCPAGRSMVQLFVQGKTELIAAGRAG